MPIEFNCRFCGAMIRVPDKAKGGKGKCPKCGVQITVPKKSTISPPTKAKAPELPFELPKPAAEPADDADEVTFKEFDPDHDEQPVLFADDEPAAEGTGVFGYAAEDDPVPTRSSSKRKKKQKSDPMMLVVGGVIVAAILVLAALILVPILTSTKIPAELRAATAESLELPPVAIDKSRIDLPPEDLANLLKKLEQAPATISSSSTQVTISANANGLLVSVAPGSQHWFYRVDPAKDAALVKYLKEYQDYLNDERFREVNRAMMGFVNDYWKALTKKSGSENMSSYRDSFAIPSLVKGFGNQLAAHSGRSVYRCIYEDQQGGLYFLLPAGLTEFEIKGREDSNGRVRVPVEIQVKVEGKIDPPKKSELSKQAKPDKKAKPEPAEKEPDSDDEVMNGNK